MSTVSYCPSCLTTFRGEDPRACPNLGCGEVRPDMGWGIVLQPGDRLDRHYEVDRVIAVGGAGLTYKARELDADDKPFGPMLAIKVLYSVRASGAYLRRLATEAQILQELDHENIVQCRGFVHRAGHEPYLVTLFEEGGSLAQRVKKQGTMPVRMAAAVLRQILLGLDTAHQRGVVHRDLKPDNVLLAGTSDVDQVPRVRLADFGIAKVAGGLNARITKHGAFVGTPEYAAPEQFEQQGATAATDIFACGGLLFNMLTGRPPIHLSRRADIEASYDELLNQLPPAIARADAPGIEDHEVIAVNEILFHTMTPRPEHRWTAHQVIAALQPLLGIEPGLERGTLEVTRDPAPKRDLVPLDSQSVPVADREPDRGETQPFLIGEGAEPTDELETEPGAPERVAELLGEAELVSEVTEPTAAEPKSAPPLEPPRPAQEPDPPPRRGGALIRFAALILVGILLVGAGAGLLSLAGVAVVGGIALGPGSSDGRDPDGPEEPTALTGKARRKVQDEVQREVSAAADACGVSGQVVLTAVIGEDGSISEVVLDPMFLRGAERERCLADAIEAVELGEVDGSGRARLALEL